MTKARRTLRYVSIGIAAFACTALVVIGANSGILRTFTSFASAYTVARASTDDRSLAETNRNDDGNDSPGRIALATNGKIAFSSNRISNIHKIFTTTGEPNAVAVCLMCRDGEANLTGFEPAFKPDGTQIIFVREEELWLMNADGTGQTRIGGGIIGQAPQWSPDGTKIVFHRNINASGASNYEIFIMDANGGNQINITNSPANDAHPSWGAVVPNHPQGRIAFQRITGSNADVFVMEPQVAQPVNVTVSNTGYDTAPKWSPDGTKLVFASDRDNPSSDIYTLNPDTNALARLTNNPNSKGFPAWSPDGTKIVHERYIPTSNNYELYTIDAVPANPLVEGVNITNNTGDDWNPHWGPGAAELARVIRAGFVITRPGQPVTIDIELLAQGDETTTSFTLNFDPTKFSSPVAILGDEVPAGAVLGVNTSQVSSGKLGILITSTNRYAVGTNTILRVRFNVSPNAPPGPSSVSFGSSPTAQGVSSSTGTLLPTSYQPGTLTIPSGCGFSVDPESQTFGESANIGVVTVTQTSTGAPCPWRVQIDPYLGNFVTFLSNTSGTGNGTFSYGISANTSGQGRAAAITIIDVLSDTRILTYIINQNASGGSCTYYVTPTRMIYDVPGGTGSFQVIAPQGCPWTAVANSITGSSPWISINGPSSGTGTADITYTVDANDGQYAAWRIGSIEINGQREAQHGIYQSDGGECPQTAMDSISRSASPDGDFSKEGAINLDQLRSFRDKALIKTSRGPEYIRDYYEYAGEITKLLIFNPSLFYRSKDALVRYQPVVDSILRREQAKADQERNGIPVADPAVMEPTIVNDTELAEIDELLSSVSELGSGQLRRKIEAVRRDLQEPKVQAEFGVRIAHGPKRLLPNEQRSLAGMVGGLLPFDLGSGFQYLNPFSAPAAVAEIPPDNKSVTSATARVGDVYGQIPLSFEANNGQVDAEVKFLSRGAGYNLFLTPSEAVLALPEKSKANGRNDIVPDVLANLSNHTVQPYVGRVHTLRMKLDKADPSPRITALDKLSAESNYFVGNNRSKWRTSIPNYASVQYNQVYKGVDLIYYGNQRQLEYDFKVAPGADPKVISMSFSGADTITLSDEGDLLLNADGREVRLLAPVTYQEEDGVRREIASRYVLTEDPKAEDHSPKSVSVGFEIAAYDTNKALVIDPVLVYSTYLGGSGEDNANSIAVDSAGNAYVIGFTDSTNFPVAGAIQSTYGGNPQDIFVSKLNAPGTALVYSTYLGGNGQDNGSDIAVDAAGNAYITGYTASTNFPMASALQATRTGFFNTFVAKLNPTGSQLVYSTYYGGTIGEYGSAIAVDANGSAYVGGVTSSPDMPKVNPIQSNYGGNLADAYVAKLNRAGSQIVYATFLGGNGNDGVTDIAIDTAGSAYITGVTFSTNFPTANALQPNFRGGAFDAFVTKLNPAGTALVYSTYRGGTDDDRGYRIALDAANNVYVGGQTQSSDFPTASALQPTFGGGSDAFVTKFTPAGAVSYSTFLGGSGLDGATGLAVNPAGNAFLTGFTTSTNFPLADPSQSVYGGGQFDAFASNLNSTGSALAYSTYLGGGGYDTGFDIAVDPTGNAYVFGRTASTNFPTFNPFQGTNRGGAYDTFITKLAPLAVNVGVSGRVTTPTGLGLRNAVVAITDSQGVRRTATTSSFGIYSFDNVRSGETYTLGVSSKRYRFATRILQISGNLTDLVFVGLE